MSDLGNTGAGGALTAMAEVVLAVRTADDANTRARSTKTLSVFVNVSDAPSACVPLALRATAAHSSRTRRRRPR